MGHRKDRENFFSVPAADYEKKDGEIQARVNPAIGVVDQPFDGNPMINSVYDMILAGMKTSNNGPCLGWRNMEGDGEFKFHSYNEVHDYAVTLGTALIASGLEKGDKVGSFSANSPNVTIVDVACSSQGLTIAPLYDSLSPNAVEYIVQEANIKVAFVQDDKVPKMIEVMEQCPMLKLVVVMGSKDLNTVGDFPEHERVITLSDMMSRGTLDVNAVSPGGPDDLAILMYTSGTTGNPKGVMIKNRAIVGGVAGAQKFLGKFGGEMNPKDTMMSYLPLAHIFAQTTEKSFLLSGGKIGYWQGAITKLLDDLTALRPTIFFGVPRVYARFEQKIREQLESSSFIKKAIFNLAYNMQVSHLKNLEKRSEFLDKLVFSKIKDKILPEARFCVTGAAPMSAETNDFLKVVLCVPVVQGYGLTETCSVCLCCPPTFPGAPEIVTSGNVGGPMNGLVKLVDIPDMNYLTTDHPYPRGELLVKGPQVFSGYYKNEKVTSEVLSDDGWFSTGDVAQLLPDGAFQIIDRKKNLFKLAHGEYVSPEHLEGEYAKCKLIGQICVYGNSHEATLVAIVVPDKEQWNKWAEQHGKSGSNLSELAKLPKLKEEILHELQTKRVESGFRKFENIVDVIFMTELNEIGQGFTVENDLMTPTFKLKRNKIRDYFETEIDALYAALKKK